MNNRIKAIAALAKAATTEAVVGHGQEIPSQEFLEVFSQKFAELIIQECASVVEENFDSCEPWMTPNTITRHFGLPDTWSYQ